MPGRALDQVYSTENIDLIREGMCNLTKHIKTTLKYGVPVVVAVNKFDSDTKAEIDLITQEAKKAGGEFRFF